MVCFFLHKKVRKPFIGYRISCSQVKGDHGERKSHLLALMNHDNLWKCVTIPYPAVYPCSEIILTCQSYAVVQKGSFDILST